MKNYRLFQPRIIGTCSVETQKLSSLRFVQVIGALWLRKDLMKVNPLGKGRTKRLATLPTSASGMRRLDNWKGINTFISISAITLLRL